MMETIRDGGKRKGKGPLTKRMKRKAEQTSGIPREEGGRHVRRKSAKSKTSPG